MLNKLESSVRIAELDPPQTLMHLGIPRRDGFCDIGAGTGIFSYAAAELTDKSIYAVELSPAMREILHSRNTGGRLQISEDLSAVPDGSCDAALLCTVLHELTDVPAMAAEIKRILRPDGILAVIEFHKCETPFGPPVDHRLSEEHTAALLGFTGFRVTERFVLGENFYCLVFTQ